MKSFMSLCLRGLIVSAFLALSAPALYAADAAPKIDKPASSAPVTVTDNGSYLDARQRHRQGHCQQAHGRHGTLFYKGYDTLGHDQGDAGVWEEDPSNAPDLKQSITIDPAKNGGERAEVSVAGKTGGTVMLTPSAPGGGTYCDIEIRYALGRGDSGVYTYAIFSHPSSYGAMGISESRYITHLNREAFDWISVDADRNMLECAPTDLGHGRRCPC